MANNERKSADSEGTVKVGRFDRFHLDERPQRKPGHNAYFDDIKEQLARHQDFSEGDDPARDDVSPERERPGEVGAEILRPNTAGEATVEEQISDNTQGVPSHSSQTAIIASPAHERRTRLRSVDVSPTGKRPPVEATDRPSTSTTSLPVTGGIISFEDFRRHWSPFLKGKQMELCEILFNNTIALGRAEFTTKTDELCKEVGVSSRHLLYLLNQLEKLGFVIRQDAKTESNKTLGKTISFLPFPPR
jgi:hypothetical protein